MRCKNLAETKVTTIVVAMCVAMLFCQRNALADFALPFVADEHTLHLWRFNSTNLVNNYYITPDEGLGTPLTMTNLGLPSGVPPFTNIFNTAPVPSLPAGLSNCLRILPGGGSPATRAFAMAASTPLVAPVNFINPESGAFTFEALVCPTGDLFTSGLNWQLFCGDNNGGVGTRGWQWRIQTGNPPQMNFNFISPAGGTGGNFLAALPTAGPNAATTNQWYHAAVTYTGNNPTNGDTPGVLVFYWTLLDPARTEAAAFATNTIVGPGTIGGTPSPAVGGSQRSISGVGNGEGFVGFIDEVRVSMIARTPTNMAFKPAAVVYPPVVTKDPSDTFIAYGEPLVVMAGISGSEPLSYQWQYSGTGVQFANLSSQTNADLVIAHVTFAHEGYYRLIATNVAGAATTAVARITVGAKFAELNHTGVDATGFCDTNWAGNPDLRYTLYVSGDPDYLGPDAIIWNMYANPIALVGGGGMFANPDGKSQWIGPTINPYTSDSGRYVYRTRFVADCIDLSQPARIEGGWWVQSRGVEILLNGRPTGNFTTTTNTPNIRFGFVITNGFVPGINTLDFVTDFISPGGINAAAAVRVEVTKNIGYALPPGLPVILQQPANQTVRDANYGVGSVATFSVVAMGRPPLSYQWLGDGAPIPGATNRVLRFVNPTTGVQPTSFRVIVSNESGSVTSQVATLTLLTTNRPPIVANYNYGIYTNQILNFDLGVAFSSAIDPDGDALSLAGFDMVTTNSVSLTQSGAILTFTPPEGYVGTDQFTYTIADGIESTVGYVTVWVSPLRAPTLTGGALVGTNLVFSGTGGGPWATFTVLSSTNLALPLANWTVERTGNFDGAGAFTLTNPVVPGTPVKFYTVRVP